MNRDIIVTAWNNGQHHASGAGYGFKVSLKDRDKHFERGWKTVALKLPGVEHLVHVNIEKHSFWNTSCRELISLEIGKWLLRASLAPWPKGSPPKLALRATRSGEFEVRTS
jgi:hypothetical protein